MRITSKGQVTIPVEIREKLGLLPNCEVEFVIKGNSVLLHKKQGTAREGRGRSILRQLQGKATTGMSTEEIMAMTRGND
jgi:AbrB family looped-hinge helix DNA binding protein